MTHKLGIDIGGTFTDFALLDEETGHIEIHKQLTTPHEPSECVLDGARNILAARNVDFSDVHTVVHGATLLPQPVARTADQGPGDGTATAPWWRSADRRRSGRCAWHAS